MRDRENFDQQTGLLIGHRKKSLISQDFPPQIQGKANRFRFQEIFSTNFAKKQLITND